MNNRNNSLMKVTMHKLPIAAVLCLLYSTNSIAQQSNVYPHLFVGAKTGYQLSTLDDISKQPIIGAYLGNQFTEHWSWDIGYQYHGNGSNSTQNSEISFFDSAIRYDWYIAQNTSLYGKLGAAYWDINIDDKSTTSINESGFSPLAEIGLNYRITPNVYLNAGYQYIHDVGNELTGHYNSKALMAGISYHFKGKTAAVVAPQQPMTFDPEPKVTSLEPQVIATKPNIEPESNLFETTLFSNVAFAFNSDNMIESPTVNKQLDKFVNVLKQYPKAQGVITGHTDSIGTAAYNKTLSEKRAQAVVRVLQKKGVDIKRLKVVGKGEAEPLASNMLAEGRSKNRRVELIILSFEYSQDK